MVLPRPPKPALSWAERPLGMLIEIMRFLLDLPGARRRALLS